MNRIIAYIMLGLLCSYSVAGEVDSADLLFRLARSEWNTTQLQSIGLIDTELTEDQMEQKVKQAVIWLEAARRLSTDENKSVLGDLEYLYRSEMVDDPGRAMEALIAYSEINPKDNLCVDGWMKYRLAQLNQRSHRDYFIQSMEQQLVDYPQVLSDMLTLRGILSAEQGDIDNAALLYENAWNIWPYNTDAAGRLLSLPLPQIDAEESSLDDEEILMLQQQIEQNHLVRSIYFEIISLTNNPLDLDRTVSFADYLYSLNKFEKASLLYSHATKLLKLIDDVAPEGLLKGLTFKNAICLYNSQKYIDCINLLSGSNKDDVDIPGTAFLILAMKEVGQEEEISNLIGRVNTYADKTIQVTSDETILNQLYADLSWMYCFAVNDIEKALSYATKIKSEAEGELSPLLAYIQVEIGQIGQAKSTLEKCPENNPLTFLASGIIELKDSQTVKASELLFDAINSNPGVLYSFIKTKLYEINNAEELVIDKEDIVDIVLNQLSNNILDIAIAPQKYLEYSINPNQKVYKYNDIMFADFSIVNISQMDRYIGENSFISPYVYVYAEIIPDINSSQIKPKNIPLSLRYLASEPVLRPGFSNTFQEIINLGKLDDILSLYPQMGYKIRLHCIPSPLLEEGKVVSATPSLVPDPVEVERRGFRPSAKRLTSYYSMLRKGQPDERVEAAQLFAAILRENQLADKGNLFYKSTRLNYEKTINAILANISHENPIIRAWTVNALSGLLNDKSILNAVTSKLDDPDWFVRLMSLYALKSSLNIDSVIQWFSENEKDETILRQIQLWRDADWEIKDVPFELPDAGQNELK